MKRAAVLAIAIRSMCGGFKPTASIGNDPKTSVVDGRQRSMIPEPVFGRSGTFPTVHTANPTITLSTLALRTVEDIVKNSHL
jgi:glucose dehydrogenase